MRSYPLIGGSSGLWLDTQVPTSTLKVGGSGFLHSVSTDLTNCTASPKNTNCEMHPTFVSVPSVTTEKFVNGGPCGKQCYPNLKQEQHT